MIAYMMGKKQHRDERSSLSTVLFCILLLLDLTFWWAETGKSASGGLHSNYVDWILFSLQFVVVSLSGWSLLFFGGYKFFTGGKGKKEEVFLFFKSVYVYYASNINLD